MTNNPSARRSSFSIAASRGILVAGALVVSTALAGEARAATAEKAKDSHAVTSGCVDEIWEIRAVPADKVGTNGGGDQVVVIEPSNERAEEVSGTRCPKPLKRTVIQIVPKVS